MKKILFLIFLVAAFTFNVDAQVRKATLSTAVVDTLDDTETINLDIANEFGDIDNTLVIQVLCTELSGTAAGTIALYGSLDGTNYVFLNFSAQDGTGLGVAAPKASFTETDFNQLTITDALVGSWLLTKTPYKYYRAVAVGTGTESTEITLYYMHY